MARDGLTTAVITALDSRFVRPIFLLSMQFADNTLYVWTGVGTIVWNGNSYLGVGTYGNISTISESNGVEAQGISLTLSGIDPAWLAESMNEINHAGKCWVYFGFLDSTGAVIPDPIPAYMGILDQPTIDPSTDTCTISITVENRLADLNRSRGGRYTDQDQRGRYPNDGSLRYVPYNQDRLIIWKT
jgi:hypothetical protein